MNRNLGLCRGNLGRFLKVFGASGIVFPDKEGMDSDRDSFYPTYTQQPSFMVTIYKGNDHDKEER